MILWLHRVACSDLWCGENTAKQAISSYQRKVWCQKKLLDFFHFAFEYPCYPQIPNSCSLFPRVPFNKRLATTIWAEISSHLCCLFLSSMQEHQSLLCSILLNYWKVSLKQTFHTWLLCYENWIKQLWLVSKENKWRKDSGLFYIRTIYTHRQLDGHAQMFSSEIIVWHLHIHH